MSTKQRSVRIVSTNQRWLLYCVNQSEISIVLCQQIRIDCYLRWGRRTLRKTWVEMLLSLARENYSKHCESCLKQCHSQTCLASTCHSDIVLVIGSFIKIFHASLGWKYLQQHQLVLLPVNNAAGCEEWGPGFWMRPENEVLWRWRESTKFITRRSEARGGSSAMSATVILNINWL